MVMMITLIITLLVVALSQQSTATTTYYHLHHRRGLSSTVFGQQLKRPFIHDNNRRQVAAVTNIICNNIIPRGGGGSTNDDSSSTTTKLILRIRLLDGSLKKIQIGNNEKQEHTIKDAIQQIMDINNDNEIKVTINNKPYSLEHTIQGMKNGTLLTIQSTKKKKKTEDKKKKSSIYQRKDNYNPYPELAKDYITAKRKIRNNRTNMGSYTSLAELQESMHIVEPQPINGKVLRIYMCENAAIKFQSNCIDTKSNTVQPRIGLLFGTIVRERKEKKRKPKTSLSTTPSNDEYCYAAKVHAIYEFTNNNNNDNIPNDNVLRIAKYLNIQPIGWIYSYDGINEEKIRTGNDNLPVLSTDIEYGARYQIYFMKQNQKQNNNNNNNDNNNFITLAMDGSTGATEAFQLSDVAVQMVAEDMILLLDDNNENKKQKPTPTRFVQTRYPIIIDGKEINELDTVLCLINTALLSHNGMYSGSNSKTSSIKRKNGTLTNKTRKAIIKAIKYDNNNDDNKLLSVLSDFQVLIALDDILTSNNDNDSIEIIEELCINVLKWSRGQRKSTFISNDIKQKLISLLDT